MHFDVWSTVHVSHLRLHAAVLKVTVCCLYAFLFCKCAAEIKALTNVSLKMHKVSVNGDVKERENTGGGIE